MREPWSISRHRWSALWNGIIIGMGIVNILVPGLAPMGIFLLLVGGGLEYWQRRRAQRFS